MRIMVLTVITLLIASIVGRSNQIMLVDAVNAHAHVEASNDHDTNDFLSGSIPHSHSHSHADHDDGDGHDHSHVHVVVEFPARVETSAQVFLRESTINEARTAQPSSFYFFDYLSSLLRPPIA